MPQPSTIAQPTSDSIRDMTSLIHADEAGFFGNHGGRFLPPQLEAPIAEVAAAYAQARQDPGFQAEYEALLADYVGRPSPLFLAAGLTRHLGGAKIYLKREDLNHTGAHKINHCLGEGLLAKRMGKKKLIAETGAGQHGVALATAAAWPLGSCALGAAGTVALQLLAFSATYLLMAWLLRVEELSYLLRVAQQAMGGREDS